MDYLEEAFWRQQFFDSPSIRDHLANSLIKQIVQRSDELAELAVRQILEQDIRFRGHPVYSPERKYQIGDELNFLSPIGLRRGLVVYISPGHSTTISGIDLPFDEICVRFRDKEDSRKYVSNCPSFPTRFSYDEGMQGARPYEHPVTPGQIVMRFGKIILPSVKQALGADPRFCTFDSEEWMLTSFLTYFDERVTHAVITELRKSEQASAEKLAALVCGPEKDARPSASIAFSLSCHLNNDPPHRFAMARAHSSVIWTLSPPPKQAVCTLDAEMIMAGRIRVSGDFQKIVDFYGLTSVLNMQAYGGYRIRAIYDSAGRCVYGEEVRAWIEENGLSPGHKVYIKSPASSDAPLVLFSEHEIYQRPEPGGPVTPEHSRSFLRHKIYAVLIEAREWLHYSEISKRLNKSGFEVQQASVVATLSSNEHVFCRFGPTRGLWGLTRWLAKAQSCPVNPQSLSITIREEQWVHRILREEGEPLSPKEVERRLSETFGVSLGTIRELTIIDGTDPAVGQLRDGRLLLISWIHQWDERLKACEKILAICQDLESQISPISDNLGAYQKQIRAIEELAAKQLAMENDIAKKISDLRDDTDRARAENKSSTEEIGLLESEVVSLGKRYQKLVHYRTISLASYSLAALCLLVGTPTSVAVLAMAGSSGACVAIYRLLRSARRRVQEQRTQLLSATARAAAAFKRLEITQHDLAVAENEYAANRKVREQLTIEEESLQLRIVEASKTLSATEMELDRFQEPRVVEEKQHLIELLGACAEVEHGRRG